MEMALWILFCLFCSVGMVRCGYWLFETLRLPGYPTCGYCVVPLYDDPERLEAHVRMAVRKFENGGGCAEPILLVDMGLEDECRHICDRLCEEMGLFYICTEAELGGVIRQLDKGLLFRDLQQPGNIV